MSAQVRVHYGSVGHDLATRIAASLSSQGKDLARLTTADLASIDEFHIRGRKATLEIGTKLGIGPHDSVLDIGSGLGGPARTLAENFGCTVTGVDLTEEFCRTANEMSSWVGLADRTSFRQGDAVALPYAAATFEAAMTLHVGMNVARKDLMYAEVHRVLKPGGVFAVYDVLQGEGGDVLYPVPWARDATISHLATPSDMRALLIGAGFDISDETDSTDEGAAWFRAGAAALAKADRPTLTLRSFLGEDGAAMTSNQVRNLSEHRIRTVTYVCRKLRRE